MVSKRLTSIVLFTAVVTAFGCAPPLQRFEYTAVVMAAEARIVLYAHDEAAGRVAARAAIDRMHELEGVMSDYRAESELSRLVAAPHGVPHSISEDLLAVLMAAQQLAQRSSGAFDITLGPLTRLWRAAIRHGHLPDEAAIASATARSGYALLLLDAQQQTATLAQPDMQLDLGGIGKGFAVDEALAVLREHGLKRCLISLAGDVRVGDPPPRRTAWRIKVDAGQGLDESQFLALTNAAVSTSGDQHQHVVIDGVRYSHIVDPATGYGLIEQHAVTVIAPDATTADGLSTALSVMGKQSASHLLRMYPNVTVIVHAGHQQAVSSQDDDSR